MTEPPAPPPEAPRVTVGRCSVCRRPVDPRFRPFCSARCKQVDLGRWLDGHYAVPGEPTEGGEDDPAA